MQFDVEIVKNALISTDGVELAADLFLPKGAPPVPALVMLLPYNKDWLGGVQSWRSHLWFARHGYACVLVDFRGTGNSRGVARAPFAASESDDGVAAIEWAAAQPWCDGRVGMWGMSYGAITTLRTASRRPSALRAIVPIMGHLDPERDFVHPYGQRGCLAPLAWALHNLILQLTPPLHQDRAMRWESVWEERLRTAEPYFIDLLRHGPSDSAWRERRIDATKIQVPSLCVVGWRDLFVDGMLSAYEQISAPKRLIAGPWMHVFPHESPFNAIDFLPMMARWWDRWLKDIPNGADKELSPAVFVQGRNRWRSTAWPPTNARSQRWFTDSSGALRITPAPQVSAVEKPSDATIGVGAGLSNFYSFGYGMPIDESDDDRRGIAFTSPPLEESLSIMGRPGLRINLKGGGEGEGPLVAKLTDVHPDGRSVFITGAVGALPIPAEQRPNLLLTFAPTAYEIAAGHRLRLMIASGDFPRLWPNANVSSLSIGSGGDAGTELVLSVLADGAGDDLNMDAADIAAVGPPPQVVQSIIPEYEVSRNASPDSVTVTIVMNDLVRSTDMVNTGHFQMSIAAGVARDQPKDAIMRGEGSATITMGTETVRIGAQIVVRRDSAEAAGEVVRGERVIFSRRWTV